VRALYADLVGPYQLDEGAIAEQELLELPPSRYYLTGFLSPEVERAPEEIAEDDPLAIGDDENEEETHGSAQEEPKGRNLWPASVGMSVLLPAAAKSVHVAVRFAEYFVEQVRVSEKKRPQPRWRRKPKQTIDVSVPLDREQLEKGIHLKDTTGLVLQGRLQPVDKSRGVAVGTQALALFLVNRRGAGEQGRRDVEFIFQVEMELTCEEGIVARPDYTGEGSNDWDSSIADLQFRNSCEYAVGHNIAVEVPRGQQPVRRVKTTWIPSYEVPPVVPHEDDGVCVTMEELAAIKSPEEVRKLLARLPEAYGEWIAAQRLADVGDGGRSKTRKELMDRAEVVRARIVAGIDLLAENAQCRRAFCLANQAMATAARRRSPERYPEGKAPRWRLFQLAFVLLNLRGIADGQHAERKQVELIFFPTGGGKTEAYLGVIALTLVLRRLRRAKSADGGLGVAVLLRYTLRLLTLDQLGRAATLICALESERRRIPAELGDCRFSVGLWVGRTATANTMEEVSKHVTNYKNGIGESPCPLPICPWCGKPLASSSLSLLPGRTSPDEVRVGCLDESCEFSCANHAEGIPVVFVDEQVYRELPNFLIATVDKFAMLPWRGESGMLFGKVTVRDGRRFFGPMDTSSPKTGKNLPGGLLPPELIVQDELHLISGPLGTMVGLYETAIDHLCTRITPEGPIRPKLLAATATVRRADTQIRALYGRSANEVTVFPPPGIDDSETFFATVDHVNPGRRYIGVAAQGRSMKALLLRIYRGLLAAAMKNYDPSLPLEQTADCYMTLVGYFNSLRELGGMRRLVEDEVLWRIKRADDTRPVNAVLPHLWLAKRERDFEPVELTSRESTDKIKRSKDRLNKHYAEEQSVDVLLASNMISVGIDIDRLGLMVVAGQPKTTAEYIQASSRVGRQAKWPGLVVTAFNIHKPRDRSHYEHFEAYHRSFYRFVEATSVTPFSGPALERGYVGALTAMIRFANSALTPGKGAMQLPKYRELANELIEVIAKRGAEQPGVSQAASARALEELRKVGGNLLDAWTELVTSTAEEPKQRRFSRYDRDKTGGKPLLCTVLDEDRAPPGTLDERFTAPTSMRDVESAAHFWVVGRRFGKGAS
ncbi:MAG TPA: DISARM system helicase DrmA, partial [Polyangiaceae bacterium]